MNADEAQAQEELHQQWEAHKKAAKELKELIEQRKNEYTGTKVATKTA